MIEAKALAAPEGDNPVHAPVQAAMPHGWIAALGQLDAPLLRLALADFAHLTMPLQLRRPQLAQAAIAGTIAQQIEPTGARGLCDALGLSDLSDPLQNRLATPAQQFRIFAGAIGAPPRLSGLTQAELLVDQVGSQLESLGSSSRAGVGLAVVAVTEQLWQFSFDALWRQVARHPMIVPAAALGCLAPDRRDVDAARVSTAMVAALPASPALDRAVQFGATQASVVMRGLFDALANRAAQLGD